MRLRLCDANVSFRMGVVGLGEVSKPRGPLFPAEDSEGDRLQSFQRLTIVMKLFHTVLFGVITNDEEEIGWKKYFEWAPAPTRAKMLIQQCRE